jgi:hypothetical protein
MGDLSQLRPGDIGFGPIHGPAGGLVKAGQLMLGEGFQVGKLIIEHAFVIIPCSKGGDVHAVEAMPSGAREVISMANRWTPRYAYARLPEDYPGQGLDAAAIARAMIGTPYSWASYAALAAWRFGWKTPRLERWISRTYPGHSKGWPEIDLPREAICSVLADQAWALTGKQVMPKGTPHQCVTPGALAKQLLRTAEWIYPED